MEAKKVIERANNVFLPAGPALARLSRLFTYTAFLYHVSTISAGSEDVAACSAASLPSCSL
eukprot:scaffold12233_cov125-Skeletonema_marinoi.AAC.3